MSEITTAELISTLRYDANEQKRVLHICQSTVNALTAADRLEQQEQRIKELDEQNRKIAALDKIQQEVISEQSQSIMDLMRELAAAKNEIKKREEYLTWYIHNEHNPVVSELAAYKATGLEPEQFNSVAKLAFWLHENGIDWMREVELDRLRELAEADKDELVIVLPCKVGDAVYKVSNYTRTKEEIDRYTVHSFVVVEDATLVKHDPWDGVICEIHQIGKIVKDDYGFWEGTFFTRAEAEAALKEGR